MSFFDKTFINEYHDETALVGLCDVTIKGEIFKRERIRLDLKQGIIRIECAKFLSFSVPLGNANVEDFSVSNVSIHSRGVHLTAKEIDYSFVSSAGGVASSISDTALQSITGFHSRPAAIHLICNTFIEFDVNVEAYERNFFVNFDFHRICLSENIKLVGSKSGFSVLGEEVFQTKNVDNAVAIVIGTRQVWAAEWQAKKLKIRLNAYKQYPIKARPIISTGELWVSLDETRANAETLFPLALSWLDNLEKQQLTKALAAIDSLLTARKYGQDYLLGLFGVFRFWEWGGKSKTLSKKPLAEFLDIPLDEAIALIDLRNDLIHSSEFVADAIKKCDETLKKASKRYVSDFDMKDASATVMNYVHSISAEALMRIIGYNGETQKYFPVSGSSCDFIKGPKTSLASKPVTPNP